SPTILDYLARSRDALVIVSERDEVAAAARKLIEQIHESYAAIVAAADAPGARSTTNAAGHVPPPTALVVDLDLIDTRLAHATQLSQLGVEEPDGGGRQSRHVRCQPAIELNGRVGDWVTEIRTLRANGDVVLFVAATPGRAERTIELLKEYDVLAVSVDRAADAQYAAVLVAIGTLSRGFRLPDAA